MRGQPFVSPHPDGYRATWPGFPWAFALFAIEGNRMVVSDLFRDPNQPRGCAGEMLADALAKVGAMQPAVIRLCNLLDTQPTTVGPQRGMPPQDTVLGRTLRVLVQALGGRISQWRHGWEQEKKREKPWVEVEVSY